MNKKQIIIAASILTGIIVIVLIVKYIKKKRLEKELSGSDKEESATIYNNTSLYKPESFPLSVYMNGPNCSQLQSELNRRGASLTADGYFGPKTKAALLSVIGKDTITKDELDKLKAESNPTSLITTGTTPTATVTFKSEVSDLEAEALAKRLYNDLVTTNYIIGRDGDSDNGLYTQVSNLIQTSFNKVYNKYKQLFGTDLKDAISDANFKFGTSVDSVILNKCSMVV